MELREVDADECGRLSREAAFHTDDVTIVQVKMEKLETCISESLSYHSVTLCQIVCPNITILSGLCMVCIYSDECVITSHKLHYPVCNPYDVFEIRF